MTRFHRHILAAAAVAFMLTPAGVFAQDIPPGNNPGQPQGRQARMRSRQHMAMLKQKLNLTDDQVHQFQKIGRDTFQQTQAIRNDSSLSDDDKKQKLQELRKQANQQRLAVLTPEQQEKLKQLHEQMKKQHQGQNQDKDKVSSAKPDSEDLFAGMVQDDDPPPGKPR